MARSLLLSALLVSLLASMASGQPVYVQNSGWSFSSTYVGQDLQPAPNQFDQDDDFGILITYADAYWDDDISWADASLSAGGIYDYVQATAGSENTSNELDPMSTNAAWSTAYQKGNWSTSEAPLTYVFVCSLAVSDDTINGHGLWWSENLFMSGKATAGDYEFTWKLLNNKIDWELSDSSGVVDSGSEPIAPIGGAGSDWNGGVTKFVTVQNPAATITATAETTTTASYAINHYLMRGGEAQTGVIVTD